MFEDFHLKAILLDNFPSLANLSRSPIVFRNNNIIVFSRTVRSLKIRRRDQDLETIMNSSLSTESWPQANSSLAMEEGNSSLWGLDYCLPPTTLVRWTLLDRVILYYIVLNYFLAPPSVVR